MVKTKKEITNEELARMINKGFEGTKSDIQALGKKTNKRFDGIDDRLDGIDNRLDSIDRSIATIETDISEIRKTYVDPKEFDDLMARVKYLETKIGVESGR